MLFTNPSESNTQWPAVATIQAEINAPEQKFPSLVLIGTTKLLPVASVPFSIADALGGMKFVKATIKIKVIPDDRNLLEIFITDSRFF